VVVEHKRDKSETGPEDLTDRGSIMTNNTSIASRHLRETIATILPLWFVDRAVELCHQTLTGGGTVPMPQKIRNAVGKWEELGVRKERLVARLGGRPTNEWDALDLAELLEAYSQIRDGASTIDEEFPATVAAVGPVQISSVEPPAGENEVVDSADLAPIPDDPTERVQMMYDLFLAAGIGTEGKQREKRLRILTRALDLPEPLKAVTDLTTDQVGYMVSLMRQHRLVGDLMVTLEELAQEPPSAPEGAAGD
jgi:hypothetical protein